MLERLFGIETIRKRLLHQASRISADSSSARENKLCYKRAFDYRWLEHRETSMRQGRRAAVVPGTQTDLLMFLLR